ncbi:serine hydrolase [Streptomyces sp. ISL-98]|uniref:serine hydrolase n=1 Tax=Streptomyces sp. ISL-98 TaxID=2819192 RepID=UPI001BE8A2F8|nr:serine hydrolase [Streptomyces sp. ISL-98]MBT2506017.1 serine hydrolase [Streptomyces sp. ISL-98]
MPRQRASLLTATILVACTVAANTNLVDRKPPDPVSAAASASESESDHVPQTERMTVEPEEEPQVAPVEEPDEEPVEEPAVDLDAVLAKAVGPVAAATDASVSVGVLDLESGDAAAYGKDAYDTASIVKVDILAALLLRAQDAGRVLTAQEQTHARNMIVNSDNTSATALWNAIGGSGGLDAANARLGLTSTQGGHGERWGLTQTTAKDQLALLKAVFGEESELGEGSRTYVQGLMKRIAAGQDWGVSAAGGGWALKNGWLPRSATGLWDINSIGRVTVEGRVWLVAVLSDGHTTKEAGIALVEDVARTAVKAVGGAR